ncbi:MAG: glycosyltransferase N-terminal domain-containing protein [Saprospiraceae bacterium]
MIQQGLYQVIIGIALFGLRIAALFNAKLKEWLDERKLTLQKIAEKLDRNKPTIWMHCSSLGEFEQGRPVFEKLKKAYPNHQFLLTFFSPSGYAIRRNYPEADLVCYLPFDNKRLVLPYLDALNIELAIFVKYDIWPILLLEMKKRNIPAILISAQFRPGQIYFQPWGSFMRKSISTFRHIFVQQNESQSLLRSIAIVNVTCVGDTRIDRVLEIVAELKPIPAIEHFLQGKKAFIAGSTWSPDEALIFDILDKLQELDMPLIIVPHDISEGHLADIETKVGCPIIRYSKMNGSIPNAPTILLVDSIGTLAAMYQYAALTYIGGGFGRGIHNTLEPAAFGRPIIFGPNHHKFPEALGFMSAGGGFEIRNSEDLQHILDTLSDESKRNQLGSANLQFLYRHQGASDHIVTFIQHML